MVEAEVVVFEMRETAVSVELSLFLRDKTRGTEGITNHGSAEHHHLRARAWAHLLTPVGVREAVEPSFEEE